MLSLNRSSSGFSGLGFCDLSVWFALRFVADGTAEAVSAMLWLCIRLLIWRMGKDIINDMLGLNFEINCIC